MPFFIPPQVFHPQPSFNPLFDLLREANRDSCQPRHRPARTFTPKFDISETPTAYELYGELAGVQPKDVIIEFTDRQTLTIRGRRERQTPLTAAPSAQAIAPVEQTQQEALQSHKATVEDDFEEVNASDSETATTSTAQNTEVTTTTAEEKPSEEKKQPEEPKPRYWIAERGVGQFSRSFEFQDGIDQEGVQASFNNGVLSIVVPKKPFESRKIEIN